jgi:hypothetical protein
MAPAPDALRDCLVAASHPDQLGKRARSHLRQVVDVQLGERRPGRDPARVDVAWPADDGVVRVQHLREELAIDVVEPGAALADEALCNERAEEQRLLPLALRQ